MYTVGALFGLAVAVGFPVWFLCQVLAALRDSRLAAEKNAAAARRAAAKREAAAAERAELRVRFK